MTSRLRYVTVAIGLGLFACSSSGSDPTGGAGGATSTGTSTSGVTTGSGGSGGSPTCGAGDLSETNIGIIGGVEALISDGTNLFYSTVPDLRTGDIFADRPSHVVRLPISGGTPQMLATTIDGGLALSSFGVDDANVYYYFEKDGLLKLPKTGGSPTTLATFSALLQLTVEFTLDATSIYYLDARVLKKVSKDGGVPTEIWKDDKIRPELVRADGDDLYFVGAPPLNFAPDAGPDDPPTIYRIAKTGGTPTKITRLSGPRASEESIWHMVVDGSSLVFSTSTDLLGSNLEVTMYSVPKAGGTPTKLGAGGPAFASQGGTVYYADLTSLKKVPVTGGTPVDLGVRAPDGAGAMALDATNLYWASFGCIYKTPR